MNTAFEQLRQILGADNVAIDAATLERYARTTLLEGTRPCAVLYPRSTDEVKAAVHIAREHGIVLYPISRGKNWGYGDACAPTENAAILDLSRMNKIIEVNTELAYAIIEPGVSQQQLYEYLQAHDTGLWLDATGAGLDASLVGNTLDRGFGHTRYGDHFLTACGMEVVLADGRVLNTGFGHYPNAQAGRVYRYGVGPFLDGLFCQSNFGIVTQIGLWLMPKPEAFSFFFIKVDKDENLAPLIDRLRVMRLAGLLESAIHIGNDLRILSGTGRYPWKEANGVTPLPDDVLKSMRKANGIGAWNAGGSITGTKAHVKATITSLRKAVKGLGQLILVNDQKLALGQFVVRCLNRVGLGKAMAGQLEALVPNYGLLKGIPTNEPLTGAQWRLRTFCENISDPRDLGCGLIWASPVLPATGQHATEVMSIVKPIFVQHGFETLVTFTLITERAMIAIINVVFDKANAEESAAAERCYGALMDALIKKGYYPYRTALPGMKKIHKSDDVFWQVASQIKQALDPTDIIARGRYIPPTS